MPPQLYKKPLLRIYFMYPTCLQEPASAVFHSLLLQN